MAIAKTMTGMKLRITTADKKITQTVGKVNKNATDDQLYQLGHAVSALIAADVKDIIAVSESIVINE